MRIGIDFDGVIFDTESWFHAYAAKFAHDILKRPIVDKKTIYAQTRYAMTEEESLKCQEAWGELTMKASPMAYVKEVLALLKKDGHELFIVSSRMVGVYKSDYLSSAKKQLKKLGFEFAWIGGEAPSTHGREIAVMDKAAVCIEHKIDILIEDNPEVVQKCVEAGIKCLQFCHLFARYAPPVAGAIRCENWWECYYAVVAEWQTRGFQEPVGNRAGSNPAHRTTRVTRGTVLETKGNGGYSC